jgi:hypothetical protein
VPGFEEGHLPAFATVGLGLISHARESAAMPHEQREFRLGLRELHILHIHLLDFKFTIGVDLDRRRGGREAQLLFGQTREHGLLATDVEAAHVSYLQAIGGAAACEQADAGKQSGE